MPTLLVVIASTRPGRVGLPVAEWFVEHARHHGAFEPELADLAEINLPLIDEPKHPRLRDYQHEHTRAWSEIVERADAFAFVTPEYNYGPPPALINAFDYLFHEWNYKPGAFVSYGGVSGGTRGVQVTKLVATTLKIYTLPEAVSIPFVAQLLDEDRRIQPNEVMAQAADTVLDELLRVSEALAPLRATSTAGASQSR